MGTSRAAASDTAFNHLNQQAKQVRTCINDGDATRARSILDDLCVRAAEATSETLSAYDARVLQENLASLEVDISAVLKRPKFSFRNKKNKNDTSNKNKVVASSTTPITTPQAPPASSEAKTASEEDVEQLSGKHLVLKGSRYALRMRALERCIVIVEENICGSALIRECKNCILVLTARQIRIHDCTHCTFLVDASTGPIIENCDGLIFGRRKERNAVDFEIEQVETIESQNEETEKNKVAVDSEAWKDVKDFNWLRAGESPNYRLLRDDDVLIDTLTREE